MAPVKLQFTATVEIHPEQWASEYDCSKIDPRTDAETYLPHLIQEALKRQESWGVLTVKDVEKSA